MFMLKSTHKKLMNEERWLNEGSKSLIRSAHGQLVGSLREKLHRATKELAELKTDSERYQLLRRGQHYSIVDGIGNELKGEDLEAKIDAKLKQKHEASA